MNTSSATASRLESSLTEIAKVLAEMTRASRQKRASASIERIGYGLSLAFLIVELAGLGILIAVLLLYKSLSAATVVNLARFVGYGMSVAAILAMFGILLSSVPFISRLRKDPFFALLELIHVDMTLYAPFVTRLHGFPKSGLEYALLHYVFHRDGLEGRIALLSGELKKIGLFPALLAVAIGAQKVIGESTNPWLWMPVILAGCFYFMAFASSDKPEKMTQVVKLLEYAITQYPDGEVSTSATSSSCLTANRSSMICAVRVPRRRRLKHVGRQNQASL